MSYFKALRLEFPNIFKLFVPILISQYAQILNGVIDTAMSARLGTVELAGVALGVAIWMPIYMFVVGILISVLIFVAQSHGAGDSDKARDTAHQGLWLGAILGIMASAIIILLSQYATQYITGEHTDLELIHTSQIYINSIAWGLPFGAMALALRFYCEGQNIVFPITIMAIIIVVCKTILNYALMFGNFGAPDLGVQGCGLATAISMYIMFFMLVIYINFSKHFAENKFMHNIKLPNFQSIKLLFKVGLPMAFGITSEFLVVSVITVFISTTTAIAVAAHQITFSCMMLFFATPAALSMASSIRIGNLYGEQFFEETKNAIKGIMTLSVIIGIVFSFIMLIGASSFAFIFTKDANVALLAASALYFGAFFQLTDSVQVCLTGILRGVGDTKIPFAITASSYWFFCIPLGYILSGMPLPFDLGISPDMFGIRGWWLSLTITLFIISIFLVRRVKKIFWQMPNTKI